MSSEEHVPTTDYQHTVTLNVIPLLYKSFIIFFWGGGGGTFWDFGCLLDGRVGGGVGEINEQKLKSKCMVVYSERQCTVMKLTLHNIFLLSLLCR